MKSFIISGNEVPFTKVLLNICHYICEEALDFTDKSWEILENEIEWDEGKEWESEEEIWLFICENYYSYAVCVYGEMRLSLVNKQIDDNYGLGKIYLEIGDSYGDLNSLFGFNYEMGEFDAECNKKFNLSSYDITYDNIITALKNDYKDSFKSLDDFVDYVVEASKSTLKKIFYKHFIKGKSDVITTISDFLNDVFDASLNDYINTTTEEHDSLLNFVYKWDDFVESIEK